MVKIDTLRRTFLAWRTAACMVLALAACWGRPATAQETGALLAHDAFDAAPGALHGTNSGAGWSEPWVTQNGDLSVPGYNVTTAALLSYRNLATTGGYATGGKSYLTAYRGFDKTAAGPFADYLTGGAIGADGKTVWLSALLRLDANNNDERSFSVYSNFFNDNLVAAGYFGTPSNDGSTRYWSLKMGANVYRTSVPAVVGQAALLVVKITFGATGSAALYVNPTGLGEAEPTAVSAEGTSTGSLAFKGLAFYAGPQPGLGALDEVRVGTTYAAVTPAVTDNEAPSAVTSLAAPNVTDKSVRLTWGVATDNVRVDGYDVYNGTTLLGTTTALEFNVDNLAAATAYTFAVKARDGAGNESAPATLNVTTKSPVKFTVQGTKILDPNGNEFLIKGANVNGPHWPWPRGTVQDVDLIANVWKFNTVRVNAFPRLDYIGNNLDLDGIVQAFTSRGIVTQIEVHDFTGTYPEGAELQRLINYWVDKANKYKGNPYVWFNIMNEPGGNEPVKDLWKTTHEAVIQAIRGTGAENIIVLDGAQFGQENGYRDPSYSGILTYGEYFVQKYSNITFAYHVYSTWAGRQAAMSSYIDAIWAKGLSVHVGEYGSSVSEASAMFNTVIPKGVGRIVWHWAGGDDHDLTQGTTEGGGWEIDKKDGTKPGNLSWMGSIIWDDNHGVAIPIPVKLPSSDLVTNGGFENDLSQWANWGGASIVTSPVHGGTKALKVASGGAGGGGQIIGLLLPNTTYRLSAWGRNSAESNPSTDIGVKYKIADGTEPHHILHFTEADWTYKEIVFTTPASLSDPLLFIWKANAGVDFFADDISLVGANILRNASFEENLDGWQNWGRLEVQTADVKAGTKALRVNSGGAGGGGNNIDLEPNTKYILSAWGKTVGTPVGGTAVGYQYKATDDGAQLQHLLTFTETDWTQKTVKFRTAPTVAGGSGNVFVWKNDADVSFLLDEIVLMKDPDQSTDELAPTTPGNFGVTATTNSATLSWQASTDNVGVTGYKVYQGDAVVATVTGLTHTLNGLTPETAYTFSVSAVDAVGNESEKATANARTGCVAGGRIFREYYSAVKGRTVADLTANPKFPGSPASTIALTQFEVPANYADNYGTRVRGYVCVPQTGPYIFWLAADDAAELWLSTSDDPAGRVKIATVTKATAPREWTKSASQKSAPVQLQAGYRYYIEALHKESNGTDHLAVGWTLPGGAQERPIPGNRLVPFAGATPVAARFGVEDLTGSDEATVYPNPARDQVRVDFTAETAGPVKVQLVDRLSKAHAVLQHDAQAGRNTVTINTQPVGNGLYFVVITTGTRTITRKVVVAK